ncbi:hypothetical protein [Roseiconus nitratireducens]|uniref:hypothetical protein n=1 Tax=Roseiconus nitratireducens TaxID=2605748 RepID=UPI001F4501D1|nr:hypothetical protein [Roseiconus nitratireducens]
MEAARRRFLLSLVFLAITWSVAHSRTHAANARSQNFLVHAATPELAQSVAREAEKFRDELALYWLGKRLPPWGTPCPIEVKAGPHLAAQGVTTYNRSPVSNFQMEVIGTPERILDSVLPHEVTHTVLATHFGRPLPRWADEGICTTVEHDAEKQKHEAKLREFLRTRRGIAMNQLFLLTEYPSDMLPMYAQGYSVCRFLIEQSGPRQFINFLTDYMQHPSWTDNVRKHYGYESLAKLQERWLAWVSAGSGPVETFVSARSKANLSLASNRSSASSPQPAGTKSLAAPEPSTRSAGSPSPNDLASAGSWYQRRREQTAKGQLAAMGPEHSNAPGPRSPSSGATDDATAATSAPARRPFAPPSVLESGPYSAAQPPAEQPLGQGGLGMASASGTVPTYR